MICHEIKDHTEFSVNKNKKEGKCYYCSSCAADMRRKRQLETKLYKLGVRYGISGWLYIGMYLEQHGRCALCNVKASALGPDRFHVDHCHKTGRVRGLLCRLCNGALGLLKDNKETVNGINEYLERGKL